jgi:hypothetical protein
LASNAFTRMPFEPCLFRRRCEAVRHSTRCRQRPLMLTREPRSNMTVELRTLVRGIRPGSCPRSSPQPEVQSSRCDRTEMNFDDRTDVAEAFGLPYDFWWA